MLVTFDGTKREIIVNQGVTDIDVGSDLYSEWKRWMTVGSNSKYPQAFRTFGGDATSPGQFAPRYYFLMNGWHVVIDGQYVRVKTNLYSDDGNSPFILLNGGEVYNSVSDSPTVYVEGCGSLTTEEYDALMAEMMTKLESENASLSEELESARSEIAEKLDTITELSMNYKYKAFV